MTSTITASTTTAANFTKRGYLYDIYHIKDKAILWIKEGENNRNAKRYEIFWPFFDYVVSDNKFELELLLKNQQIISLIKDYEFAYKFGYPSDYIKKF